MNDGFGTIRKLRIVVLGATLAVLTAGVASAAIPSADGTISACYDKQSGQVRIYDADTNHPKSCGPKEVAFSWNVQGVPGQDGADGTDGTDGTDGADGISGYERVVHSGDNNSNHDKTEYAMCPDGKQVIGGGAGVYGFFDGIGQEVIFDVALVQNEPFNTAGWAARATEMNPTDQEWHLAVYALCANVN